LATIDIQKPLLNAGGAGGAFEGPAGAIVIGGDYQGLGIVRSLGQRGIPVCVIDDEFSISPYSRYATHCLRVPNLRQPEALIATLDEAARQSRLEGWVLFPTRDETVVALSRNRELLSRKFRVPTPDFSSVQWAWDKRNTHRLAEQTGVPTVRTWVPRDAADLALIDAEPEYVLKPAIKEHFFYKTKAKAWCARSREELRALYQVAVNTAGPGEILVQEYVPGDGRTQFAYCAFFKHDRALGSMVVQRRRQHPHQFGRASTFVQTVENAEIEEYSLRYLQAMNYYGLVEIEYKLDGRTGQFKLHDVNTRTWGYHSLGAAAGVDFSALLFADQTGQHVSPCRARSGVKWMRTVTDLPSSVLDIAHGRLGLGEYLRSLRGPWTDAVFSMNDPLPGLAELALLPYLFYKRGF
jgi:predicted ATP-grasp superfamily ATP-dependent carboligase